MKLVLVLQLSIIKLGYMGFYSSDTDQFSQYNRHTDNPFISLSLLCVSAIPFVFILHLFLTPLYLEVWLQQYARGRLPTWFRVSASPAGRGEAWDDSWPQETWLTFRTALPRAERGPNTLNTGGYMNLWKVRDKGGTPCVLHNGALGGISSTMDNDSLHLGVHHNRHRLVAVDPYKS